ncbi:hypothetical protein BGZ96_007694 [Linnemannia gamsii]|uniref:Uncharacterized protein n=1 Tax=Linnemannia gamsii TaxID=64522 RepID=A0ABQ7K1Z7_9FUNG|nr:hypothetical protein BGZ96_007694 [Linnemannia gamsii]
MCQNDSNGNEGVEIMALQQCSNCFRSTGQKAFLNDQFYNVTNQQVKAMKQVCEETKGGTRIPTSGAGAGIRDLIFQTSTGWCFVLAIASTMFLIPGSS